MFHPQGPTFWELARQALSSTQHGYDLLAPMFDFTPFRTPDEILDGMAKVLGTPKSIDDSLDIACGTGAAIRILRPLCRRRVVGIDFSQGMLDQARKNLLATDDESSCPVELVQGEILNLPFEDEFDLAVTVGSLGHVPRGKEAEFVGQVAKALRPGGRFVLVTANMPPLTSPAYWAARAFNGAMRLRNLLVRPPFIMFYLTFLLPETKRLLTQHGFDVMVHDDLFSRPFRGLKLVVATKPAA
ncbi:MAG: class I SAM-dependent methyltransferase [Pirellulaceae bacterium]